MMHVFERARPGKQGKRLGRDLLAALVGAAIGVALCYAALAWVGSYPDEAERAAWRCFTVMRLDGVGPDQPLPAGYKDRWPECR